MSQVSVIKVVPSGTGGSGSSESEATKILRLREDGGGVQSSDTAAVFTAGGDGGGDGVVSVSGPYILRPQTFRG